MCQFDVDALHYTLYVMEDGELAFTVGGDPLHLGLITMDDMRWSWDWMLNAPLYQETSRAIGLHHHSLRVVRTVALRFAQYIAQRELAFFYFRTGGDAGRARLYERLLTRHPALLARYQRVEGGSPDCWMFARKD